MILQLIESQATDDESQSEQSLGSSAASCRAKYLRPPRVVGRVSGP